MKTLKDYLQEIGSSIEEYMEAIKEEKEAD